MTEIDRPDFVKGLGLLCEAFRKDVTPVTADAYWLALNDMPMDSFKVAVQACLRECTFMPTPAEIRSRCTEKAEIHAADQWQSVMGRWRHIPGAPTPNGVTEKVVRLLGGYERIGDRSPEENDTWTRKEFMRLYVEVSNSPAAMESIEDGDKSLSDLFGAVADAKRLE